MLNHVTITGAARNGHVISYVYPSDKLRGITPLTR